MSHTYIPDFYSMILYFGLLYFALLAFIFILHRFLAHTENFQRINTLMVYVSLGYSLILFISFLVRNVMAGYYHDEHGTGPSDMEQMFNYFHIAYSFIPLAFAYIFDKKK